MKRNGSDSDGSEFVTSLGSRGSELANVILDKPLDLAERGPAQRNLSTQQVSPNDTAALRPIDTFSSETSCAIGERPKQGRLGRSWRQTPRPWIAMIVGKTDGAQKFKVKRSTPLEKSLATSVSTV